MARAAAKELISWQLSSNGISDATHCFSLMGFRQKIENRALLSSSILEACGLWDESSIVFSSSNSRFELSFDLELFQATPSFSASSLLARLRRKAVVREASVDTGFIV